MEIFGPFVTLVMGPSPPRVCGGRGIPAVGELVDAVGDRWTGHSLEDELAPLCPPDSNSPRRGLSRHCGLAAPPSGGAAPPSCDEGQGCLGARVFFAPPWPGFPFQFLLGHGFAGRLLVVTHIHVHRHHASHRTMGNVFVSFRLPCGFSFWGYICWKPCGNFPILPEPKMRKTPGETTISHDWRLRCPNGIYRYFGPLSFSGGRIITCDYNFGFGGVPSGVAPCGHLAFGFSCRQHLFTTAHSWRVTACALASASPVVVTTQYEA